MDNQSKFERVGRPDFPPGKNIRFCVWRPVEANSRFCVWRPVEANSKKLFLHFVDSENLALDDLIFCDSPNFSGYAKIMDFVRNTDGTISDYTLKDSDLDFDLSLEMAKVTNNSIYDYLSKSEEPDVCVVVCLRSKQANGKQQHGG